MGRNSKAIVPQVESLTPAEFLESYNRNMPEGYPHITLEIMKRFKEQNATLFKKGDVWTLDLHRKRMIQWLPQNINS
jgi:hypothetical protein